MNTQEAKVVLEAALLTAEQPLAIGDMRRLFNDEINADTLRALLDELRTDWDGRGVELVALASGWRFQSASSMRSYLERMHPEKAHKYSRAVLETLAIIAYRQPVSRARISAVRGVNVDGVIRTLVSRGLVEECGAEPDSGALLYRTTSVFLERVGLRSIEELPDLAPLLPDIQSLESIHDSI